MTSLDLPRLVANLHANRADWLAAIEALVVHESPSRDKTRLDSLAQTLAAQFTTLGGRAETLANPSGGDHLLIRFDTGATDQAAHQPALILGHFDTVWPIGTLREMPWRVDADHAHGPGVYDMKASLVLVATALQAIRDQGARLPRPIVVLLTSDEEIGSPTSRATIEALARGAERVLVVEPPLADGSLKTARKGVGAYEVAIAGRAAHAGVEPEQGISAIDELARLTLALHALSDPAAGTSVNVGVVAGGTAANVVAAAATARVDVRAGSASQAESLDAAIQRLKPHHPDTHLAITGGFNRPPMERTPGVAALFGRAQAIGRTLGLDLGEGATGGGSDGNFTAALGVPTLDGLGVAGAGAHALAERIALRSFPERVALLAGLLLDPEPLSRA